MEDTRKTVRSMQDYINEHIADDISPADLARVSNFSPWYARKLFIRHLGMTPAVYIRRLRLSKSALRLRDENVSVLEKPLAESIIVIAHNSSPCVLVKSDSFAHTLTTDEETFLTRFVGE